MQKLALLGLIGVALVGCSGGDADKSLDTASPTANLPGPPPGPAKNIPAPPMAGGGAGAAPAATPAPAPAPSGG